MSQELAIVGETGSTPNFQVQTLLAKDRETMMKQIGSGIRLSDDQQQKLRRQATLDVVDILPSGELYVPGNYWRQVLNDAFGPMGWGVRASKPTLDVHEETDRTKSVMYREVFLVVSRCNKCLKSLYVCDCKGNVKHAFEPICVSMAMGAQEYHPTNARMTYDDAAEASVTNGLMRCCKPFGVFENIWDKRWAEQAKNGVGVMVVCDEGWGDRKKVRTRWRRHDAAPLGGEKHLADGSPNADKYVRPETQQRQQAPRPQSANSQTPKEVVKSVVDSLAAHQSQQAKPATGNGEKILVVRPVAFDKNGVPSTYWVVNTDADEYFTEDESLVRALETAKANGKRIAVTYDVRQGRRGARKVIAEFRES